MAPFSIPKNLSFISVAGHWLKISVKYRWLFVCVFFLNNGTTGRVIPPNDTSAVVKGLQDRPAYVVEQKEKLENMLGDIEITQQGGVYYAQLPQDEGSRGRKTNYERRNLIFSDDINISKMARNLESGTLTSHDYRTAVGMLFDYDISTSEFDIARQVTNGANLDSLIEEKDPEEQKAIRTKVLKYDINDLEGSQPPDVDQIIAKYKQLIELEPTYENYKGILEYAKGPPNSSVDDFIKYSQKAIELSPTKEEKLENMEDFTNRLGTLFFHEGKDYKLIKIAINVVQEMIKLDPEKKSQYQNGIKYMKTLE